jgi:hypothetical protein
MTKVIRISEDSELAALEYGSTVSKGIKEMAFRLSRISVPQNPEKIFEELFKSVGFWNELESRVERVVTHAIALKSVGVPDPFIRASALKVFGNINEDEKLVEPVGRRGRELR